MLSTDLEAKQVLDVAVMIQRMLFDLLARQGRIFGGILNELGLHKSLMQTAFSYTRLELWSGRRRKEKRQCRRLGKRWVVLFHIVLSFKQATDY